MPLCSSLTPLLSSPLRITTVRQRSRRLARTPTKINREERGESPNSVPARCRQAPLPRTVGGKGRGHSHQPKVVQVYRRLAKQCCFGSRRFISGAGYAGNAAATATTGAGPSFRNAPTVSSTASVSVGWPNSRFCAVPHIRVHQLHGKGRRPCAGNLYLDGDVALRKRFCHAHCRTRNGRCPDVKGTVLGCLSTATSAAAAATTATAVLRWAFTLCAYAVLSRRSNGWVFRRRRACVSTWEQLPAVLGCWLFAERCLSGQCQSTGPLGRRGQANKSAPRGR